jgi:uncharacterized protein (UPF0548 family)
MAQACIPVPQLWLRYVSTNTIPKSQCCNHRKDLANLYRNMARRQWAICKAPLGIVSAMTLPDRPLTYSEIGATAGQLPDGYTHLRVHRVIGHGEPTFRRAADRLMSWQMHRAAGLTVEATTPRVEQDTGVRLRLGRHLLRISFGCQVVYVVEEERRRGFAYGTLQGHPEQGEERFCVEWRGDDAVVFTVTAFSRPGAWWSRVLAPISHRLQQRYTRRYLHAL